MKWFYFIFLLGIDVILAAPEKEPSAVLESVAVEVLPMNGEHFKEVEKATLDKYFAKKPNHFLIDPQVILSSQQHKTLETILTNHSADSSIDLYLLVFGEDQKISNDEISKDFVDGHFSQGKPVAILYYYFGKPSRTELHLSPSIAKVVSTSERERSVQSSLIRAMRTNGSFEQLEELLMQFSVRTYWMERMMDEASGKVSEVIPEDSHPVVPVEKKKKIMKLLEKIPDKFKGPALIGAGALVSVVVLLGLIFWLRSRARFIFPEIDIEARLGGSHAAGIGAVVNFASPAVSPAHQRQQVPEYMRRA